MADRGLLLVVLVSFCLEPFQCQEDGLVSAGNSSYVRHEVRLLNDLLKRSHKYARPVKETNDTVEVAFGIALLSIDDVNEQSRTLTTSVWIRQLWRDAFLSWEPADYGGVDHIRVPVSNIWTADITVYNSKDHAMHTFDALVLVYSSGDVLWIPPATITSMCTFDLTYFPFDDQECILQFGSWTYNGWQVTPTFYGGLEDLDMSEYVPNPEWKVISTTAKLNAKYYPCCDEPYPDLTFQLRIRRNARYYSYIYLGPAVLLALLAPFVFLLPPGDTQKMTLGCGILICFTLLFSSTAGVLIPSVTVNVPLIDVYYMSQYVLLSLSIAMTTIIANIAKRAKSVSGGGPPECLRKLTCLGRCLGVSYDALPEPFVRDSAEDGKTSDGQVGGARSREWLLIAMVLDRFFFVVYLVLTVVVTLCVLLRRG